jgi:hypothetical protein
MGCFRCNGTGKLKSKLGMYEECPSCPSELDGQIKLKRYPDEIVPAVWQNQKIDFDIETMKKAIGSLNTADYGLSSQEVKKYIGFVSRLLESCSSRVGLSTIRSTILSAPIGAMHDDLVYECLKSLIDQKGDIPLVPYITGYELYDLVMGRYLPHNIDSFYGEVNGISKKLSKVSKVADKLKSLNDQGLLAGIKSTEEAGSKVKQDVLLKGVGEGSLTGAEIDIILDTFKSIQSNLGQLAQYNTITNKRGYTLDDYINAPIVFISLGSTKPLFKYEIPGLSLLLDIRGRNRRPTIVLTHSPALIYQRDPDGAGQFFKHYVYAQCDEANSRIVDINAQGRLESVSVYRQN